MNLLILLSTSFEEIFEIMLIVLNSAASFEINWKVCMLCLSNILKYTILFVNYESGFLGRYRWNNVNLTYMLPLMCSVSGRWILCAFSLIWWEYIQKYLREILGYNNHYNYVHIYFRNILILSHILSHPRNRSGKSAYTETVSKILE